MKVTLISNHRPFGSLAGVTTLVMITHAICDNAS